MIHMYNCSTHQLFVTLSRPPPAHLCNPSKYDEIGLDSVLEAGVDVVDPVEDPDAGLGDH